MITVEAYRAEFHDDVVNLISTIQQKEFGIDITPEQQPDLADIPNFYQHGAGNFWVAFDSGELIGTIALLDIGNFQGALRKMFVKLEHRKKGAAKILLQKLMSHAAAAGIREIYLGTTSRFLDAHRFYEKNGFTEVFKEQLPQRFPVMKVDSKFYLKVVG